MGAGIGRASRAIGLLAVLAVGAGACGSSSDSGPSEDDTEANQAAPTDEGEATPGGTLRVAMPAEIDGLNPTSNRWSIEGNMIASAVFDPLLTFDENRELVPMLAESVVPNDEGTVWTITVREGVEFHDGTDLDAEAVKLNIDTRKSNPLTGGALAPVEEVVVVDPLTVEVRMSTPWFGYDYTLAAQGGYMAAPAQIEDAENSTRVAIGTGPFRQVGQFSTGQPIELERNDAYWDGAANLDGIEFSAISDASSRQSALTAGDVDMILTETPATIVAFRDQEGIVQVEDPASEEAYIMLNFATPPFDNEHARLALAYATDQAALIDVLGADVLGEAEGPYVESERYHNPDSGYPGYDPAKAEEELAAYEDETGQPLSFTVESSIGATGEAAEALVAQWNDLGIDATYESLEQTTFLSGMFVSDFQAAAFRNFGYVNPDSNYIFWHSSQAKGLGTGSINFNQMTNPELDALLDEARASNDDDARLELYREVTPTLNATVPYIWMYHSNWALAASDSVGGLTVPQELGFSRQDAKPWWDELWLQPG